MRSVYVLWREERRARWFFAAHLQGGLGAAAGYIALMLLAYERIGSAWAATAVMLADLVPSMLLGPLMGALADRTSRLGCAIASDIVRAGAFAGLMFCDGIAPMIALALLSGIGNSLFRPATAALLPDARQGRPPDRRQRALRHGPRHRAGAGSGVRRGPAPARRPGARDRHQRRHLRRLGGPAARPPRPGRAVREDERVPEPKRGSPLAGIGSVIREPAVRTLMGCSGCVVLAAGTMNVAELVLAQEHLGSGRVGFALLVSSYGIGLIGGSLLGARDTDEDGIRRRYLGGMALMVAGLAGSALSPALGFAMLSFAVTGVGDGLFILSDRVLLQRMVPERLHGRAFGLLDSVEAWAFGAAVVGGGALATAFGGRVTFAVAGLGMLLVLIAASRTLSTARIAVAFRPVPAV